MNNKIKKIMATTLISMTATSAIGCATSNTKLAHKINNGVEDLVSSINNLDYVETNTKNSNLGKIVSAVNESNFYTKIASDSNIENTITRPSERTDNFKLYILSNSPYISLTSDDNNNMDLRINFSTEKIENTSDDISEKINQLILKRAILMIYVNEIFGGNVTLNDENRKAINAYVNIIKENTSFLNGNRGMVKNQLGMANNLISNQSEDSLINYYIIKSGEALETRSSKFDSTISAIDSIISILEQNLSPSSCYYQNNLTSAYENMMNKVNNATLNTEDETLAKNIVDSINLISPENNITTNKTRTTYPLTKNITNSKSTKNNSDCIDCDKNTSQINTNQNNNVINKSISNNQPKTLEYNELNRINDEMNTNKTTLKSNISKRNTEDNLTNQNNSNYNNNYLNKRSSRARVRKQNQINNESTVTNPTLNTDKISDHNNTILNKENTRSTVIKNSNRNTRNTFNNDNHNRATRVPYKVSTDNFND